MYEGFLTLVRALQLVELKLSDSMANIEQNKILFDKKKKISTFLKKSFNFFIICFERNL